MRHQANLNLLTGRQKDHLPICRKNWVPTVETDALEEVSDVASGSVEVEGSGSSSVEG